MSNSDFSIAVVCSSNMNRSMEAHAFLRKKGFNVRSFGTGDKVKLPGTAPDKPNIYDFGCSYDAIYKDLCNKDVSFYTQNGLLNILDRNRRIKNHPEKFQLCNEQFTMIITCEERVYDQVLEYFETTKHNGNEPVHVINIDIQDNHEDATIGAFLICDLVTLLSRTEDLDNDIERLLVKFEEKRQRLLLHWIGLAMAAAVKGYKCVVVMPMKMSREKVDALRLLGAKIIRTPTSAAFDELSGLIRVAQSLHLNDPENTIILDQYRNKFNPLAHFDATGQELLEQTNYKIDAVVAGTGTGGTITGIGRKLKQELGDSCRIIAADPFGSILALPESLNKTDIEVYDVEGIGYDFVPTVLDRSVVDEWIKTDDKQSFPMARRLAREEGLLCGGSSGSAMYVALQVAKTMKKGQRLVVILPDGIRNYMSKFVQDEWMQEKGHTLVEDNHQTELKK